MSENQNLNPKNIIAFQGVEGAHSDLACRQAYPYMSPKAYDDFEDVFKAVEAGEAEIGMIPVGNSYAGRVAEIHNLLPKTKLSIVGEYFLRIEHHLLGVKGTTTETITDVFSHPQALMQCGEHIKKYGYKTNRYANTAIAAKDVAGWKDTSKAAIASSLAGELYGLEVVEKNFEDDSNNTTLFLAFSKTPIDPEPAKDKQIITSMLFTLRNIPAGLYKALGGFATNHVNIIKLESYIPETESSSAQFFISFEGSPRDKNIQLAIEELGFFTKKTKLLGVYYAHKARRNLSE